MRQICAAIDAPKLINVVEGGKLGLPAADYAEIGYQIAIHPGAGFMAAAEALRGVYTHIKATGSLQAPVPLMDFAEISRTMGFEDVWAFERRHAAE